MDIDVSGIPVTVSTGRLPAPADVDEAIVAAAARALPHTEGAVADCIPTLARADPGSFGVALAEVGGEVHEWGTPASSSRSSPSPRPSSTRWSARSSATAPSTTGSV